MKTNGSTAGKIKALERWHNATAQSATIPKELENIIFTHLMVAYVCLFFSMLGSTLLIILMSSVNYCHRSLSIHLRCLAVSDVLNLVIVCLWHTDVYLHVIGHQPERLSMESILLCWLSYTLLDVPQIASAWYIVTLSFDRFIAIVYPLKQATLCTRRNAIISCTVVLILSIIFEITASMPRSMALIETDDCSSRKALITNNWKMLANTVLALFIPIPIIIILNFKMLSVISKSYNIQRSLSRDMAHKDNEKSGILRASFSLGIVCLVSVITLSPMAVHNAKEIAFIEVTDNILFFATNMIRLPNYALNFYVLMLVGSKFRKDMVAVLCGRKS